MNDPPDCDYPRDLAGYGAVPPHPRWPGSARIAVQFVLNYEEGAENCVLHGDAASETFLSEIIGAPAFTARHLSMESLYEYGARAGVWRLLRLFEQRGIPVTVFGVAMALARNPAVVDAFLAAGHEIASHGWRWISYQDVDEAVEREHIARAVDTITRLTGTPPAGWYTGRDSPRTRRLVVEHGGFAYDADSYADDLPYWTEVPARAGTTPHLVVPYTLDTNDMRFATPQGFNSGDQFFAYLRDAFDTLYAEGDPQGLDAPKMLSIGLHARLVGRPGRTMALARFLDHVQRHDAVWIARRIDIARHWIASHPYAPDRRSVIAPVPVSSRGIAR
jgi:allantoinase